MCSYMENLAEGKEIYDVECFIERKASALRCCFLSILSF